MALLHYLESLLSEERKTRFNKTLSERTTFITVVLEDVFQMHNASAVIRSCEVFGIQEAHLVECRLGKRLDRNIALGAQKWVDIHRFTGITECISTLRRKGYRIIAATPCPDAGRLDDFVPDSRTALLFGTEKEGLSGEAVQNADGFLTIPMAGLTESLNVSVTVGIFLYQLMTALRNSGTNWRLTENELLERRMDWAKKSIKSSPKIIRRFYGEN